MAKKIKIDSELYEKLKGCAEIAGYSGVDEFITHILEKTASEAGGEDDQEKVKEKLRGLGYLS